MFFPRRREAAANRNNLEAGRSVILPAQQRVPGPLVIQDVLSPLLHWLQADPCCYHELSRVITHFRLGAVFRGDFNFLLHRGKHFIKQLKIGIFKKFKILATSIFYALSDELLSKKIGALLSKRRCVLHSQHLEQWSREAAVNKNLSFFSDSGKPPLMGTCLFFFKLWEAAVHGTCLNFSRLWEAAVDRT